VLIRLIAIRVLVGIATLFAVSAVVFLGMEALPGDAATAALGEQSAQPEVVAQVRHQFGLDRPVLERYGDWLAGFVQGDLGQSLTTGYSVEAGGNAVSDVVARRGMNTAALTIGTVALLIPLGVLFGLLSAIRRDRMLDHTVATTSLTLIALPEFVVGTLLAVVFAVWLGVLPPISLVSGDSSVFTQYAILVLPVLTLLASALGQTIRMVRACVIEVLQAPYVEMARLKGLSERRVLLHHALPNALGPTIQAVALNIAYLAGGVVVVEAVFQYPGIGSTLAGAVSIRDAPVVQGLVMVITVIYVVVNLCADIAIILLNPRLRRAA
jgi:peptide/nickel transport system permease protein